MSSKTARATQRTPVQKERGREGKKKEREKEKEKERKKGKEKNTLLRVFINISLWCVGGMVNKY